MNDSQTLAVVLAVAGAVISILMTLCTTLLLRGQRHVADAIRGNSDRLDTVSKRLHRLNNWCWHLAGKNGWEPPETIEPTE